MSGRSLRNRDPGVSYISDAKTASSNKRKRSNDEQGKTQSASSKTRKSSATHQKHDTSGTVVAKFSASPDQTTILLNLLNQNTRPTATTEPPVSSPPPKKTKSAAPPPPFHPRNPFEELLGTLVVSRPIHRSLSHRAIRTLLSPPYALCTPRAILDAGEKRVFEALAEAKTLHKDKTAAQLVALAETCLEKFEFHSGESGRASNGKKADAKTEVNEIRQTELEKLRQRAGGDGRELKNILTREVKGLGKTGTEIFLRRIQRMWGEFWPVVDGRTAEGLRKLGLPDDAESLRKLVDECWDRLDLGKDGKFSGEYEADGDEEAQKRATFVEVLRQAIDVELKGTSK